VVQGRACTLNPVPSLRFFLAYTEPGGTMIYDLPQIRLNYLK
jgi:hypothetical protein